MNAKRHSSQYHHRLHQQKVEQPPPRHNGFWLKKEGRKAQYARLKLRDSMEQETLPSVYQLNKFIKRAFKAGDICPMEFILGTTKPDNSPQQRIMTVFEFTAKGPVFYSNLELKPDEPVSMMFWCPLLGGLAVVDGKVELGEYVPPPKVKPGEEPPCPCVVPSGIPATVNIDHLKITRIINGTFETLQL